MIARDGKYYQRRWQIGFDGKETNVDEKQVDFVIGSGNHSLTYLHLTSRGALQVLPLSWYSEKGGYWDMSPGYDQPDFPGSVRPVHYECMFCHNAYPKIPEALEHAANAEMTFLDPVPEGIDCQRCHGPGQRHVALASAGAAAGANSGRHRQPEAPGSRSGDSRCACNATWRPPAWIFRTRSAGLTERHFRTCQGSLWAISAWSSTGPEE